MTKYHFITVSPSWHQDLVEILEMVVEDSELPKTKSMAKVLLDRLNFMGTEKHIDKGEMAQIVVTDAEQRFVRGLAQAMDLEDMEYEFSHVRSKYYYQGG